jgi:hypothetical protein
MILDQVKSVIPAEFNVKEFLDLSELDSKSKLYKAVSPLKEEEFKELTKIVFYHSAPLVYTFNDLPADSLIQLQKMLVYIDIPNFFCLIVSDKDLKEDLEYICKNYCVGEESINQICLK